MTEIYETELPGIGVRQEFDTTAGARLGVLTTRSGRRELLLYDEEDPDSCRAVVHLDPADSSVLADLLGANHVSETATSLQRLDGLAIDWLAVGASSSLAGKSLAAANVRGLTGANIVAIIHKGQTNPSPGPDDVLDGCDVVVAFWTPDSVDSLLTLLNTG
ncbi:cation:proton antiporter regulatory subunit [soil metagenome]